MSSSELHPLYFPLLTAQHFDLGFPEIHKYILQFINTHTHNSTVNLGRVRQPVSLPDKTTANYNMEYLKIMVKIKTKAIKSWMRSATLFI